jgi:hypothetical protein
MSFQWIFDGASEFAIDRKEVVAVTQSRDGTVRATSRGPAKKRFEVVYPDGPRWSDLRSLIEGAEALDRHSTAPITIKFSQFPWFYSNVAPVSDLAYTVICVSFPQWRIFARDQVGWDGPFVFVEV